MKYYIMFHLTVCIKPSFIYFPLPVPKMSTPFSFLHSSYSLQYFVPEIVVITFFFASFDNDILKINHRIALYATFVGSCTPHVLSHLTSMVSNLVSPFRRGDNSNQIIQTRHPSAILRRAGFRTDRTSKL
jgi:hypothetical protein